ncbi:MAG: CoA pyrophosphatase [Acidobacteriota bacterium]|nr:CoA pyrophosphatase [Acidobacteriota bacterium]MDW3228565.1 CoA pyrophosphatase [Acidobacteriota bacterium]MDY0230868.1 CoA pyrophosphatase [Candidatus Saccharicenans sp.]
MAGKFTLELLQESLPSLLKGEKPGLSTQLKLSPMPPPSILTFRDVWPSCLRAAVLLLLYSRHRAPYLVFIRRSSQGNHHQNQISFPGGQINEPESVEEAAIRETQEEIGLNIDNILVAGELTPLYVQTSNYCIFPVVAITRRKPVFIPNAVEVAEVIEVPLAHLMERQNLKQEVWTLRGQEMLVPYYQYGEHKIWGATAMILAEFLEILTRIIHSPIDYSQGKSRKLRKT